MGSRCSVHPLCGTLGIKKGKQEKQRCEKIENEKENEKRERKTEIYLDMMDRSV